MLIGSPSVGFGSAENSAPSEPAFVAPFLGGSLLTAFAVGLGAILAGKLLFGRTPGASKRVWKSGAWRSADYEERLDPEWGSKLVRRRKSRAA